MPKANIIEKSTCIRLLLVRIFIVGTGVPDGPQNTNFGRDIVFSADLCYNEANEKASPFGRGGGVADGEGKTCENNPLTRYRGSSPQGRAFGRADVSLWVWALPDVFVKQMRNWR